MAEHTTVVGVFEDRTQAAQALAELRSIGFSDNEMGFAGRHDAAYTESTTEQKTEKSPNSVVRGIVGGVLGAADVLLVPITGPADATSILESVLPVTEEAIDKLPYPGSEKNAVEYTRPDAPMTMPRETSTPSQETAATSITEPSEAGQQPSARENTTEGIVTGGVVGGVLGAAAAFFIPGIGPVLAGGILATTLGGAAIGSVAGGFLGLFTHAAVPEEKARYYEQEFKNGRTIVTVNAPDRTQKASEVLQRYGAMDVQTH